MSIVFKYREGRTEPIDITLTDGDGAANITGYQSVALYLRSADGAAESEASTADSGITVTSASAGTIKLHPSLLSAALTYAKRVYYGYIIVVDSSSKRSDFPSNDNFEFRMLERFAGDT